jgi:hypothetical protein
MVFLDLINESEEGRHQVIRLNHSPRPRLPYADGDKELKLERQ